MRTQLDVLVRTALAGGGAVPAFTCYDFTTALAVVEAAEHVGAGVILLVAPKTAASPTGLRLIRALRGLADAAAVPVSIQLDHANDVTAILAGVAAGADAVLVDGSALTYEENIQLVRAAREAIGDSGIVLEAELGGLAGDEDRAFALNASGLTDADQVADFVARSGAQLLAVAIGNVHGRYAGEPRIRWDVLDDITSRTNAPVVLHGASGLAAQDLAQAPARGVGKVNFNTELRTGVLSMLQMEVLAHREDGENLLGLIDLWRETVRAFTAASLETLSGRANH